MTLAVRGVAANGATVPVPGGITYSSRNPAVATVTADGRVTAVAVGDAQLVLAWTGEALILDVVVLGSPVAAEYPGDSITVAPGFSTDFRVVLRDAAGHDVTGPALRVSLADPGLAAVAGGRVEGRRPGRTELVVDWGTGHALVPVRVLSLPGVLVMSVGAPWSLSRLVEFQPLDGASATTTTVAEPVWGPALSPDGRMLAVVREPSKERLGVIDLATGTVRAIPGTSDAYWDFAWSPDGQTLLYTAFRSWADTVRVMEAPLQGGPPRFLAYGGNARWVEQGRVLAWECGKFEAIDWGGGICLDAPDAAAPLVRYPEGFRAAPSPAGGLAFLTFAGLGAPLAVDLPGGARVPLDQAVYGMAWSPDGLWLAAAAGNGGAARVWLVSADGAIRMWREGRSSVSWGRAPGH